MYTVIILKTPEKYLKKLSGKIAKSIAAIIDLLKTNPYPPGYAAIIGVENTYRLRAGDYRIIYTVYKEEVIIEVIDIVSRGGIYSSY